MASDQFDFIRPILEDLGFKEDKHQFKLHINSSCKDLYYKVPKNKSFVFQLFFAKKYNELKYAEALADKFKQNGIGAMGDKKPYEDGGEEGSNYRTIYLPFTKGLPITGTDENKLFIEYIIETQIYLTQDIVKKYFNLD